MGRLQFPGCSAAAEIPTGSPRGQRLPGAKPLFTASSATGVKKPAERSAPTRKEARSGRAVWSLPEAPRAPAAFSACRGLPRKAVLRSGFATEGTMGLVVGHGTLAAAVGARAAAELFLRTAPKRAQQGLRVATNPRLAGRPGTAPGVRKGSPRLPRKAGRRRRQRLSHAGGWGAPSSLRDTREGPLRSPPLRPVLTTRNAAETEEPRQAPPPAGSAPQEAARAGEARPLRAVVMAAAPLPGNINKRRVTSAENGTL